MKKNYSCALLGMALVPGSLWAQQRPNIVYVFPDQFRNMAMGFWNEDGFRDKVNFRGDPVETPNLNRFAREAVVLTSAESNCPISSPHRGSLMTGMYPNRSGVPLNCNSSRPISYIREEATCLSDVFARNGYDCGYIGKLHADLPLPNDPQRPGRYVEERVPAWDAYTPPERRHGFNFWYSYGTFDVHKNPHYWDTDGRRHDPRVWSPLHEAKVAADYIRNTDGRRDSSKPFLLMIGMNPPHSPYASTDDCMEEDYALYKDRPIDSLLVRPNADRKMTKARSAAFYFASVTGVDRAFGMILQALRDAGLEKNTIVVFTSDHGETMCSQGVEDPKNSPYREAMNVPFMVRWPGRLAPRTDPMLLSSPDIMPTLLGMAGLEEDTPDTLHGRNLAPLFFDAKAKVKRPEGALYFRNIDGRKDADGLVRDYFPNGRGIKTDRYTMAIFIDRNHRVTETVLYDDRADPYQLNNLDPKKHKRTFKKLRKLMMRMLRDIDDPWAAKGFKIHFD